MCWVGALHIRQQSPPGPIHLHQSLSSSSLTSNSPPSNLRFFLFLFPSAFLLSLQLFSFPGKKHPKKHLSTLQIVPISSAPLRKNVVFWPRPKFIAFFDCLSSSLQIPELAFASVIRTALACLVATFSVLTLKSSVFDLRSSASRELLSFFYSARICRAFPPDTLSFLRALASREAFSSQKYPLNCFLLFFSFRGVCQQITSTSASSRPPSGARLSKPSKSLHSLVFLSSAIFIASHSLALHIFTCDWYVLLPCVPPVGSY